MLFYCYIAKIYMLFLLLLLLPLLQEKNEWKEWNNYCTLCKQKYRASDKWKKIKKEKFRQDNMFYDYEFSVGRLSSGSGKPGTMSWTISSSIRFFINTDVITLRSHYVGLCILRINARLISRFINGFAGSRSSHPLRR